MAHGSNKRLLLSALVKGLGDAVRRNDQSAAERYRGRLRLAAEQIAADDPVRDALGRFMILGGTDEPTIWPPVAYHDPHIDRPNSHPVSRAYCSMWCGICLRLPARKVAAS
jgi:hypothetical protein